MAWTSPDAENIDWSGKILAKSMIVTDRINTPIIDGPDNSIILANHVFQLSGALARIFMARDSGPNYFDYHVSNSLIWRTANGSDGGQATKMTLNTSGDLSLGGSTAPQSGAVLFLQATNKGFLAPYLTDTQMRAISTPAEGLMVYNSSSGALYIYTSGAVWKAIRVGNL